ncbi:hypothetical protein GW943_02800 [Candidatus Parcubacteria bacterium]|uniref:Uncharacterized protein n=1 Tax=Candidatus Kaiserbacteria bacterium CG10_big_fil_rev_8_21_14_0_10_47_16 TaxID=1974608 RepID=A0A2H0UFN4_9BACT|nr:hypothetical protein [Candidatus Parcubacteria bacterium]PIR84605.1 MAG: hypothetical protein COU16_03465 [Candidatus Kaiserbacteria bacterium CG10_big_fil_rev_8_21_14_0_10_47_16]
MTDTTPTQKNRWSLARYAVTLVLILSFAAAPLSITSSLHIQKQEAAAQWSVLDAANLVKNTFVAAIQNSLQVKEFSLDAIAYALAKQAIQSMTTSIVQWINSGFKGSPAFVQNLEFHLNYLADRVASEFFSELGGGFLCAPFQLNVRAAISLQYNNNKYYKNRGQCSLSSVAANIENFGKAGVTSSWGNFMQVAMYPQNNPYGSMALAQQELTLRIVNARNQEVELLSFGDGFLSYRDTEDAWCIGQPVEKCPVITPGKVISEQLNKSLGAGQDVLVSADEINEIIGALFAQLTTQAITGVNGLLGVSSGQNGSQSYLNQVNSDKTKVGYDASSYTNVTQTLQTEQTFLSLNEQIVTTINGAATLSCSQSLPTSLVTARSTASAAVTSTRTNVSRLEGFQSQLSGTSNSKEQETIFSQFQAFASSGVLHSPATVTSLQNTVDSITAAVTSYEASYCKTTP